MNYQTLLRRQKELAESAPISTLSLVSLPDDRCPSLDFCVDGISLAKRLALPGSVEFYGVLGRYHAFENQANRKALLGTGPSEWEQPRIALYYNCYCGDPYCGMCTAERIDEGATILWTNFVQAPFWREINWKEFLDVPPIRFEAKQYRSAIEQGIRT